MMSTTAMIPTVPATLPYVAGDALVPLRAGEPVAWKLQAES